MNTFTQNFGNYTHTENGMLTHRTSNSACVDLFFNIGASRGKDIVPAFWLAYSENSEIALRIALWARDVRQGAGERQIFRDILKDLDDKKVDLRPVIDKIPELGRWDDMLTLAGRKSENKVYAYQKVFTALRDKDGLAAKWMPRKGHTAAELRYHLGMTPKQYRKTLVGLTSVVETPMCKNDWDNIDFEKVPSLASARYKKAFIRHGHTFEEYVEKLAKGEAKVNTGAVFPYDVLKTVIKGQRVQGVEAQHIAAQWDALPNYLGENKILPMVDVSGSMTWGFAEAGELTAMDVAVSLGLYLAAKNSGDFHNLFLTFSESPTLHKLYGDDIIDHVRTVMRSNWGMNTDLVKAFREVLAHANNVNATPADMPDYLLILSDMQFDACAEWGGTAMNSIRRQYQEAGYELPNIVFWNLNAKGGSPVTVGKNGVALVSGFSPAIVKTVLAANMEEFTPEGIMMKTIMSPRYAL